MTIENDKGTPRINGLAAITFAEHEFEMHKQARKSKRLIAVAAASALICSNLVWLIATKIH